MKKHQFIGLAILILIIVTCFSQWDNIRIFYIQIAKQSAYVEHIDKEGKRQGKFIAYLNGKLYIYSDFKDGLKDGWSIKYYPNGKIQDKLFYNQGKADGLEKNYYPNGVLNYSVNWGKSVEYGNEFHYNNNGEIINYDAFDLKNVFCYVMYKNGKFSQILGTVVSPNIYSLDNANNTPIILQDEATHQNISDLYIPIAMPPSFSTNYVIKINDHEIKGVKVLQNTVLIKNVFLATKFYQILIVGEFKDFSGKLIKKDSVNISINITK